MGLIVQEQLGQQSETPISKHISIKLLFLFELFLKKNEVVDNSYSAYGNVPLGKKKNNGTRILFINC